MYFTDDALDRIQGEYALLQAKYNKLISSYYGHRFLFPESMEHAQHGFMRRLGTLLRCVRNTFRVLPPDRGDEPPERDEVLDATINIQAFTFNIFGAIDNLAWIWVTETQLKRNDGSPIPNSWIGMGPNNIHVRKSMSKEFQKYLSSLNGWFKHLENFRHALAHRIPLYIPPYTVSPDRQKEWQKFEKEIMEAVARGDVEAEAQIKQQQRPLCKFRPLMMHSYGEQSQPMVFHPQLIADFMTIEELAVKFLSELPEKNLRCGDV